MNRGDSELPLSGHERFRVERALGSGAYGDVYEVFDLERHEWVALKTLHNAAPAALASFKKEFRSLADVAHPNLCELFELFREQEQWYFTMELVRGHDFLSYVSGSARVERDAATRGGESAPDPVGQVGIDQYSETLVELIDQQSETLPEPQEPALGGSDSTEGDAVSEETRADVARIADAERSFDHQASTAGASDLDASTRLQSASALGFLDTGEAALDVEEPPLRALDSLGFRRLRRALVQLARGVTALHVQGKLHRDLKPSNVMVTRHGRVLVLDFGLVTDIVKDGGAGGGVVVGTPAYMSPEQGLGEAVTAASDWYSVGVMLYQALTGRTPYRGSLRQMVFAKQLRDPPSPRSLLADIPADLDALCMALLDRHPEQRPRGEDVLKRLGARRTRRLGEGPELDMDFDLVGRDTQLAALREGYARARSGGVAAVLLHGPSGVGKSSLVECFLAEVAEDPEALVLAGRCHQQEALPFKAWDELFDGLARALGGCSEEQLSGLYPRDAEALVELFPALRSSPLFGFEALEAVRALPPRERLRRAFRSVKDLLSRLARRGPLVLFIDDLQWGDVDSAELLEAVLRPPGRPALLLVGSYRSEELETSPTLRRLAGLSEAAESVLRRVAVGPLSSEEVGELAQVFEAEGLEIEIDVESITRESEGNPYLITELFNAALTEDRHSLSVLTGALPLDTMIQRRVGSLPDQACVLLELLAVAGQPLSLEIAARALEGVSLDQKTLRVLRAGHFARARTTERGIELECYHGRISDSIAEHLDAEVRVARHRSLARALEAVGGADPERLSVHYEAAGEADRFASSALEAGERAYQGLAFERAAGLYERALEAGVPDRPGVDSVRARLARCLSACGRGLEAGRAYKLAAAGADPKEALELEQRAAHQFYTSGYFEEGEETLRAVLEAVDMTLPSYTPADQVAVQLRRGRLRMRGHGFVERSDQEIEPGLLLRIDACWSVASAMNSVDFVASADFTNRMLALALEAGEPSRVARGLASEAYFCANLGHFRRRRQLQRSAELLAQAVAIAERGSSDYAKGFVTFLAGVCAYIGGRFREAHELCERAERTLTERCRDVTWELDNARCFNLWCLVALGRLDLFCERLPALVGEARRRQDLTALLALGGHNLSKYYMFQDRLEAGQSDVAANLKRCQRAAGGKTALIIWNDFLARVDQSIYLGEADAAWALVQERWAELSSEGIFRMQFTRVQAWSAYGRAALASAGPAMPERRARLVSAARRASKELRAELADHSVAEADLLEAGARVVEGRRGEATDMLVELEQRFRSLDMMLLAALAGRARAILSCQEARVRECERWLREQGVVHPSRISALYAPGLSIDSDGADYSTRL